MTYLLAIALVGLILVYAAALLLVWHHQEQIVFQPPGGVSPASAPARQVRYRASDDVELFAYVIGECSPDRTVVLAFHGNADLSRWLVPWATILARETGACVVLAEYRGYDGLAGAPSYAASSRDALAALAYVRDSMKVSPANTVYFGHSLGTAIAAELATHSPPRVLVLQSPFSSARAMTRRMIVPGLWAFWRFISRVHFDTVARVRTLSSPVWVCHGDKDLLIPARMGRDVFEAAGRKGELLIVRGAGHNNVAEVGGSAYWSWLMRAIAAHGPAPSSRADPSETRSVP